MNEIPASVGNDEGNVTHISIANESVDSKPKELKLYN